MKYSRTQAIAAIRALIPDDPTSVFYNFGENEYMLCRGGGVSFTTIQKADRTLLLALLEAIQIKELCKDVLLYLFESVDHRIRELEETLEHKLKLTDGDQTPETDRLEGALYALKASLTVWRKRGNNDDPDYDYDGTVTEVGNCAYMGAIGQGGSDSVARQYIIGIAEAAD